MDPVAVQSLLNWGVPAVLGFILVALLKTARDSLAKLISLDKGQALLVKAVERVEETLDRHARVLENHAERISKVEVSGG